MAAVKYIIGISILTFILISHVGATCVFATDFGLTLDCAFKKSGLFRVRNLGGIKSHVSLGFSVGDELGFGQSLSNLDTSKRRSVSARNGAPINTVGVSPTQQQQTKAKVGRKNRLTVVQPSTKTVPSTTQATLTQPIVVMETEAPPSARYQARQLSLSKAPTLVVPPFKPIPPAQGMLAPAPFPTKQSIVQYSNPQGNSVRTAVPTKPTPNQRYSQNDMVRVVSSMTASQNRIGQPAKQSFVSVSAAPVRVANVGHNLMSMHQQHHPSSVPSDQAFRMVPPPTMSSPMPQFPTFQGMPSSIAKLPSQFVSAQKQQKQQGISVVPSGGVYKNTVQVAIAPQMMQKIPSSGGFVQNIGIRNSPQPSVASQTQSNKFVQNFFGQDIQNEYQQTMTALSQAYAPKPANKIDDMVTYNSIPGTNSGNEYSNESLAARIMAISKATNVSVETIEAAIKLRQQQILNQMLQATQTTTTTTSTTPQPIPRPTKRYQPPAPPAPVSKVMNAPKEYYPVGYDKNFDDNFVSKVELPETSFHCGDQKHFPGLYGDEDLGCMVFHVCALTDDGLIMKSFLCPESTLFDQTILKCNWWFYVDCKNSKSLYDSNIPISKSYQLMKALTFFSSYKKEVQATDPSNNYARQSSITENEEGVKDAVKILQAQSQMELPKVEIVEATKANRSTTQPEFVRNSKYFSPVNVNEVNGLSTAVSEAENLSGEKEDVAKVKNTRPSRIRSSESKSKEVGVKTRVQNSESYTTVRYPKRTTTATSFSATESRIETDASTEKSVEKSTSVIRNKRKRMPGQYLNRSKEVIGNSSEGTTVSSDQKHRTERASEEVEDILGFKRAGTTVPTNVQKENIDQKFIGNLKNHRIVEKEEEFGVRSSEIFKTTIQQVLEDAKRPVTLSAPQAQKEDIIVVTPSREDVEVTINKMDQAILG